MFEREKTHPDRPCETLTSEQVEGVPGDDLGGHLESRIPFWRKEKFFSGLRTFEVVVGWSGRSNLGRGC